MALVGCGTTRMSDTLRTGTEQMLLSTAIDRSISEMDFEVLSGKDVYFDPQYLRGVSDEGYIISSIRQKLLAEGVFLKAVRDEATYVVEARAGAVGTNRQDVLIGIPQTSLPTGAVAAGVPTAIPEIPFAKKTNQKGVAKIAVFAYNQVTGQALWQSGAEPVTADARDTWVLGTGPFQRGSIYTGSNFMGQRIKLPWTRSSDNSANSVAIGVPTNVPRLFPEDPGVVPPSPPSVAKGKEAPKATPASFVPAVPPSQPQPGRIPATSPPSSTSSSTSGFRSDTFSLTQDAQGSSGGNAAAGAAGVFIYRSTTSQPATP
ncbi:DUF6655 family protein [Schlesneria paludicola]|uniref:DUF6655 family protein n=1 Tax=Schlesneria paludicola TaxID=360056 RepID=UPI000681D05E|nr:DUF6655 family protein [Schlesneria paludicola]